MEEHEIKM